MQDWPPIFGSLYDTTTVREFWGKYWHQTVRKVGQIILHVVFPLLLYLYLPKDQNPKTE